MARRAKKMTNTFVAVAASAMLMTGAAVERAQADIHGAVIGGIILCGLSGGCGTNNNNNNRGSTRPSNPGISSAQRQQNREVQGALNAFNFPVGTVDGSIGPRSRAAIGDYQSYMGMPATGQLTEFERNTLVDSHRRLQAGAGQAYPNMMAQTGPRGLLRTAVNPNYPAQYGDRLPGQGQVAGLPNTGGQQPAFPNNGGFQQPQQGGQFPNTAGFQPPQPQPQPGGQTLNQTPQQTAGIAPLAPLQPLQPAGTAVVSAASRCEIVELRARAQGVTQAGNIADADQALSEKFCDARSFSIAQGTAQAAQFAVSENELLALCGQIETAFASKYGQLAGSTTDQIRALVTTTAGPLGLTDPGTATAYGKICLGLGYRQDNSEMALAGALTLMNAGQAPYGELIGHHLREGFGVSKAPAAAGQWYDEAITALETGATPAFEPSTTRERVGVIRAAMEMSGMSAGL